MVIFGPFPLVGAPFCGAPVRLNMLNMPKSVDVATPAQLAVQPTTRREPYPSSFDLVAVSRDHRVTTCHRS